MKRFSERMGITKPPILLLNEITPQLQNCLWNVIYKYLGKIDLWEFLKEAAHSFFKVPVDEVRVTTDWIRGKFYNLKWNEVYDFFEFFVQHRALLYQASLVTDINNVLERENSGYRLVNGKFVPITNEQEIKEIEEAIEKAAKVGIEGAKEHLSSALSLFAQKPKPDYRNSIKESISAVASVAAILSGKDKDDFAPALEELSEKIPLHGALKEGFKKLYGYTSDEDGIRHAILEDHNVGYDEAKFMLVSCSAFVNFLFSKAQKAGLLKEG